MHLAIINNRLSYTIIYTIFLFLLNSNSFGSVYVKQDSKYDLALEVAGNQNYIRAIDYLKKQIEEETTYIETYIRLAEFYRYDKNLQDGKPYFLEAIQNYPENSNFDFGLALIFKYSEEWASSFDYSKTAIDKGASSPAVVELLVESAIQSGRTNSLPTILRRLRTKQSQKHLYDFGYAFWRYKIANYRNAKLTILKYLKENNDNHGRHLLGEVLLKSKDFNAAITSFLQANRLTEAESMHFRIRLFHNIGLAYFESGALDSAEYYYSKASNMAQKTGALAEALDINIAYTNLYKKKGWYSKLAESCLKSIEISLELNESSALTGLYFDLANAYLKMGDRHRAIKYYTLAADEAQKTPDSSISATSHFEIARIYKKTKNWNEAIKHLNESVEISRKDRFLVIEYKAKIELADVHEARGEVDNAKNIYQQVLRNAQYNKQYEIAETCFVKIAYLYKTSFSNLNRAKYYIARADGLARETSQLQYVAIFRWMQGEISLLEDNIEKAETYFLDAIQLGREMGSYESILAGNAGLVKTYLKANFPDMAAVRADTMLNLIDKYESLCDYEDHINNFDLDKDFFIPAIEAYARVGNLLKIYEICEKYKALKHFKDISQIRYKIKSSLADSSKWKLDDYKKVIYQQWSELWDLWLTDNRDNLNQVMNIKNEISQIFVDRKNYLLDLAENQPEYFNLVQPKGESISNLRSNLEELNSAFVHYIVGENITNILVVRADSIFYKQVNIGSSELIDIITQISPIFSNEQFNFIKDINSKNDLFRLDLVGRLYKTIFEPIRSWIPVQSSVIISADNVLNCIPFECFVTNPEDLTDIYDYYHAKFLVEDYNIFYIPYAKFLNWSQTNKKQAKRNLLVFTGFTDADISTSTNNKDIFNISNYTENLHCPDMNENEVNQIVQAVGNQNVTIYTGSKSTKDRYLNESQSYRIIHLALPGILEESSPLYSKIFFSDFEEENGFLEIYELFNTKSNAEMLIINSLNRYPSNLFDANGLNTLVHAANYAGIPSIITSLWNVDEDDSVNKLLIDFYTNLKLGMGKSEALRQAKIAYLKAINPNPNYWARYILIGNPQPIEFRSTNISFLIFITLSGVLALMVLVFWQFTRMKKEGTK